MLSSKNFLRRSSNRLLFIVMIIVLATLLFHGNSVAQSKSKQKVNSEISDQEQKELDKAKKIKVKVRTKYAAFYNNAGKLPSKKTLTEKTIFDRHGNIAEQIRYTSLGPVQSKYVYKYDAKDNLISLENIDGNGDIDTRRTSKYDNNGNEIERTVQDNKHRSANTAYFTYDKNNNLIETKNYSGKGELLNDITIGYNGDLPANVVTKDGRGNVKEEINSVYNTAGKLVEEKRTSQGRTYNINYDYDNRGNLIKISNPQYQRFYTYNSNNDLIEDKMFMTNGPRQFRVKFNYLTNGLQKEEIRFDNNERAVFYGEYKYQYYK